MIDIHCHILSGIDDGPDELAGSIAMARAAAEAGVRIVVATPHLRGDFPKVRIDEVSGRVEELRQAVAAEGIEIGIEPGGEVSLSWALDADDAQLKLASYGQRGADLLIETPTFNGMMVGRLLSQIAARGYRITLAHPERLHDFQRDPGLLDRLVEQGVMLQVNADAILSNPRKSPVARLAHQLARNGLISAVASDGHRAQKWRPVTSLPASREALNGLFEAPGADIVLDANPAQIIAGERLGPPAVPLPQRGGWLRRGR